MDKQKKFMDLKSIYIVVLYSITLLRSIGPWSLVPTSIDSLIFNVVGLIGGLILLLEFYQMVIVRKKFEYDPLLFAFLCIFAVSILINREFSFFSNVKNFAWEALFLLTIYHHTKSVETKNSFFVSIQKVLVSFGFIMSFVSILMFVTRFSYSVRLHNKTNPLRIGFVENRLFGAYADPNYAAVMCAIVIFFSLYLYRNIAKSFMIKSFLIFNIVIQFLYISLSGSRNGLICLMAGTALFVFFEFFYSSNTALEKGILKKLVISLIATGVAVSLVFLCVDASKKPLTKIPAVKISGISKFSNVNMDDFETGELDLSREDLQRSGDISNMRFTLWKSGIEIVKTSPIVGVGPKSIHDYAQAKLPKTYLAQTKLAVHNAYLNVLVCTGILGAGVIFIFMMKTILGILKFIFSNNVANKSVLYYLIAVTILAVSGLFHNEIFFMTTSSPLVFWIFLGAINRYIQLQKNTEKNN